MALTPGSQLGPYEIQAASGAGVTADVYLARDTRLDRAVAIKVVPPHWTSGPTQRARFESEAKKISSLSHPHIRLLHDIGRERPRAANSSPAPGDGNSSGTPAAAPGSQAGASDGVALPTATDDIAALATSDDPEVDFLVLEHLEGETVADRLARGAGTAGAKKKPAFRMDEAIAIAMQIADALDKAHQKGLVHRGVKPRSVCLVRGAGKNDSPVAKLLDFGMAGPPPDVEEPADPGTSLMPTREQALPQSATDVEYLAPEQLEGKPSDARTDIFALGVVFYEMLTGRKAFEGKSRAVLVAAIMTAEPDPLLSAQPLASPALDHVLKRCLAKDADDRWQTAHDLLIQLRWVAGVDAAVGSADSVKDRRRQWLVRAAMAAALVTLAALSATFAFSLAPAPDVEPFQYRSPVVGLNQSDISISPNGQMLAFMARPNQQQPASLFVRNIGALSSRRLAGTDDATQLFWSPDSRSIAFLAGGKLRQVDAAGGPPKDIAANVQGFMGGTWNTANTILFGSAKGLFRVSAEGGKPTPVTTLEKGEAGHYWPAFLPDGRHYIYQAWSEAPGGRALFWGVLDSKERTRLVAGETNVVYTGPARSGETGYLVFHREATVFARAFDAERLSFAGDEVQIAGGVSYDPASGRGDFDVSQDNSLVYFQGDVQGTGPIGRGQTAANMQLAFVSRGGGLVAGAGEPAQQGDFDLSPDGTRIAVTRQEGGASDIWLIDWQRSGNAIRLTRDPGDDVNPVWSFDNSRVAFTSYRKGNADVYVINANGLGNETPLLESPANEMVEAWSHDGRYIAYLSGQDNFSDIYALPMFGDRKPLPVVQGQYQKNEPQFSYDGKWLAYTSDESGAFEVYVISFPPKDPATDLKEKISVGGGGQPRWRQDGTELFYRAPDNRIMSVTLDLGKKIQAKVPELVGAPQLGAPMTRDATRHQLSVTPDGQRYLIRVPPAAVTGARGTGGTPQAATVYDPATGRAGGRGNVNFNAGAGGGRGFSGGLAGLTVIRNWTGIASERKP